MSQIAFETHLTICFSPKFDRRRETYENQIKFGKHTFSELEQIRREGYYFNGIHHEIEVFLCCDWKAGACIEGINFYPN